MSMPGFSGLPSLPIAAPLPGMAPFLPMPAPLPPLPSTQDFLQAQMQMQYLTMLAAMTENAKGKDTSVEKVDVKEDEVPAVEKMEEKEPQEKGKAGSEAESSPSPDTPSSEKRKKKRKRDETKDEKPGPSSGAATGCEAPPVVTPLVRIRKVGEFYLARGVLEVFARFTPTEELPATSQPKADKKADSEPPAEPVEKPKAAIHEIPDDKDEKEARAKEPMLRPKAKARPRPEVETCQQNEDADDDGFLVNHGSVILFLLYIL